MKELPENITWVATPFGEYQYNPPNHRNFFFLCIATKESRYPRKMWNKLETFISQRIGKPKRGIFQFWGDDYSREEANKFYQNDLNREHPTLWLLWDGQEIRVILEKNHDQTSNNEVPG